jgi:ATP-binding cassette subfamily B protein
MARNNSRAGWRGRPDLDLPKAKLNKENLREVKVLFAYLRPYRGLMLAASVALMFSGTLNLAFPFLAGRLMDAAMRLPPKGPSWLPDHVNTVVLLMFSLLAFQCTCTFFQSTTMTKVGQGALAGLRRDTYGRLICLPMTFFGQQRVGELNSRLSADLTQIESTLIMSVPQFLRQSLLLLGGIALIAATSGRLTLIMLCAIPPLIILAVVFGRMIRKNSRETQDKLAETGIIVEETLQGIFNVKAFVNEAFEIGRYGRSMDEYLRVALRGAKLRGAFIAFIIFSLFGSIVVVLWSGATLLQNGQITIGQMTQFVLYTVFVAGAMGQFADLYSQLQKAVGATHRVRELLQEKPEFPVVTPGAAAVAATPALPPLKGEVEFRDVHFRYPARPEIEVLKGVTFAAQPGEKIALVGPSGAGKSTIISLLLRFYDPQPGVLLVDGRPAPEYPLDWLRNQMSVVPQETLLFGGTIFENIAYGRPGASEAEVVEAARLAHSHEFITAFPEKYQTLVGERGVKLSGGQRQRVAIARAILKDPTILILDEATSSLDSESERLVQLALDTLMEGRTTFMIAHRLATVRRADRILVIQDGAIVESGTHGELNQQTNGLYRRLAELQFTEQN